MTKQMVNKNRTSTQTIKRKYGRDFGTDTSGTSFIKYAKSQGYTSFDKLAGIRDK